MTAIIKKYEDCTIEYPAIYKPYSPYTPGGASRYGVVIYKDKNEHLTDEINWLPTKRSVELGRWKKSFSSQNSPLVTLINSYYETLVNYRAICDARNIPHDIIFRHAIADVITNEYGELLELIFLTLSNPADWAQP